MSHQSPDGFKIITYLRDDITSEVACRDKAEAEELLTALTMEHSHAIVPTSDGERIIDDALIAYDRAEMWIDGSLVALGLRPSNKR